ncbi:flagellar filament capping protein FliD [Phycicoccus sonneratiae]|uniref:Flagellar hook-associated protein 2 n=1 Tax=Phycicoccus sonneratiae TaxID=2807628 RepID=A0ABS2CNL1_9MICO|nr:flagellar filament capping protein FliD [Phycicoccus sonneraticus]MBM6401472.1 flagellar filament capping protein FliD [Phycicoccus sonneraticus]
MASIDGLISGLDTTSIISSLMTLERKSGAYLSTGKSTSQSMVSTLQSLNSTMSSLADVARSFLTDSITKTSAWSTTTSGSTQPGLASVVSDGTAAPGSATFTVTSVATAGAAVSRGTVPSLSTAVTSAPVVLGKGLGAIGATALLPGTTLSAGGHTVRVTQGSSGATLSGVPLGSTVTIDAASAQLVVDTGSGPTTINLAAGTYTPSQLAAEVTRAAGGALRATIGADGSLALATTREGSAASLRVDTANAALGLSDTATTATGTDAVVAVDGVSTTLTDLSAGSSVTLPGSGTDQVVLSLAGGLRAGSATVADLGLAAGSTLGQVAAAVGTSAVGASASTVQVSAGAYRLQLTSASTGADSDLMLSAGAFGASGLGDLVELQAGTDTVLHVGTGPGAYDVRSSTASVTGLMSGVTITALKADPSTPVTTTVTGDTAAVADRMAALVAAANQALTFISSRSGYDADTKRSGALLGNSMTQLVTRRITDAAVGGQGTAPSAYGVSVGRDGQIAFDRTAFLAAYAKDPAAVRSTLTTMASTVADVATQASDPLDGYLTKQIGTEQDRVRDYTQQITAFEARMTMRESTLKRQYAALETALGTLKSQSDWLTAQLKTLPSTSSSG